MEYQAIDRNDTMVIVLQTISAYLLGTKIPMIYRTIDTLYTEYIVLFTQKIMTAFCFVWFYINLVI